MCATPTTWRCGFIRESSSRSHNMYGAIWKGSSTGFVAESGQEANGPIKPKSGCLEWQVSSGDGSSSSGRNGVGCRTAGLQVLLPEPVSPVSAPILPVSKAPIPAVPASPTMPQKPPSIVLINQRVSGPTRPLLRQPLGICVHIDHRHRSAELQPRYQLE